VKLQSINLLVHAPVGCRAAGVKNNFCRSPPKRSEYKNRVVIITINFLIFYQNAWLGICNNNNLRGFCAQSSQADS